MDELVLWRRVAGKATMLLARTRWPDLSEAEVEEKAARLLVAFVDVERSL